jgi:capsular polysaccharide biosynthesis protein
VAAKNVHGERGGSVVWRAVWRARWAVLVAALVAGVGGYLVSAQQSDEYTTQSRIVLEQTQPFSPLGDQSFSDTSRYVLNQASTITSQQVIQAAVVALADGTTFTDLYDSLDVTAAADSDVITVEGAGATGEEAAARVRTVVDAYRTYVGQSVADQAAAAEAATVDPVVVDQIRTRAATYGDGVFFAEEPPVPGEPTGPHPVRDGMILALVAALVAVTVALWRRSSTPDSSLLTDPPVRVLGSLDLRTSDRAGKTAPTAEDSALTAVALDYAIGAATGPVILTGLAADSPVGPVVDGLAAAQSARGRRVLVLDADGRGKPLAAATSSRYPVGPLAALVQESPAEGVSGAGSIRVATLDALDADGVKVAVGALSNRFDVVFLRVGPVTTDARAYAMLAAVAAVVAVVNAKDKAADLAALTERVEVAGRPLVGLIEARTVRGNRRPVQQPAQPAPPAGIPVPGPSVVSSDR